MRARKHQAAATSWWQAPLHFAAHVIVGTLLFALIAGVAAGLQLFVDLLEKRGLDGILVWGARIGEYSLFSVDFVLFLAFLARTGQRTWKEL